MRINLKPVFLDEKKEIDISYVLPVSDVESLNNENFKTDISVKGKVSRVDGVVTLDAVMRFGYTAMCDRCAAEVSREFEFSITEKLTDKISSDCNDDYIVIPDMQLELNDLVVDTVLLGMPTKFLCSENCKGICPVCGLNLNHSDYNCTVNITDPRWDKLKNLLQ